MRDGTAAKLKVPSCMQHDCPQITAFGRRVDALITYLTIPRHSVLPDAADVHPLKATISYDALVDPNHPLRREGVDGIELYLGESRAYILSGSRMDGD